jgi:hypothetical protein
VVQVVVFRLKGTKKSKKAIKKRIFNACNPPQMGGLPPPSRKIDHMHMYAFVVGVFIGLIFRRLCGLLVYCKGCTRIQEIQRRFSRNLDQLVQVIEY